MITDEFIESSHGTKLHCIFSAPQGEIKGLVQIVHGMAEYAARYEEFIEFMTENGYFVFGHDHIGHGLTAEKGDLGYIPSKVGADWLVDDTIAVAKHFAAGYPEKPLYIMGHSMGSFITRCVISQVGEMYTAVALSGTNTIVPGASIGKWLTLNRAKKNGEHSYSKFVYGLIFGGYNNKTKKRTSADWICTDESVVDKYLADEYCNYHFTMAGVSNVVELNMRCNKKKCFESTPKELPIFLMAGTEDPVGNYGKGIKKVCSDYLKTGHKETKLKLYEGIRHEVLNDKCKQDVMNEMLAWFDGHR